MFRKTTATPSTSQPLTHATTARDLSALRQTATPSKINFLSPEVVKKIQEIADVSIQNKERVDSLMHSMHSAKLNIEALEEKEQNNKNENLLKPELRDAINEIKEKEKGIKENISNISKDIQFLQKKQEQQASAALQRERDFRKHLNDYQSFSKTKKVLEAERLDLSRKNQVFQRDMDAKRGEVQSLGSQMESLEESIKEMLKGKAGESYEEMMQASTLLLKKHGMQLLSKGTLDELTKYLFKMTDYPRSKSEQIKSVENKYTLLRCATYFCSLAAVLSLPVAGTRIIEPFEREMNRLANEKGASLHEQVRIKQQYELASMAANKKFNEIVALFGMAAVVVSVFMCIAVSIENKLMEKKLPK